MSTAGNGNVVVITPLVTVYTRSGQKVESDVEMDSSAPRAPGISDPVLTFGAIAGGVMLSSWVVLSA